MLRRLWLPFATVNLSSLHLEEDEMSLTITGTIAGTAVTSAPTPVFTATEDSSAGPNFRRWYITTVATANGAAAHSVSCPFYVELHRPAVFKPAPQYDASGTRVVSGPVGRNTFKIRIIKGVNAAANLPSILLFEGVFQVPAGADVADAPNVRAVMSLLGGLINEDPVNLTETFVTGLLG